MQEARRRQKELEQVERQNAAAASVGPGPQATPHFAVPSARPHSARSARFAEGTLDSTSGIAGDCVGLYSKAADDMQYQNQRSQSSFKLVSQILLSRFHLLCDPSP